MLFITDQLAKAEPGSFDFVILDDPILENYLLEYEKCITLMRTGGMMLVNDVSLLQPRNLDKLYAKETFSKMNFRLMLLAKYYLAPG